MCRKTVTFGTPFAFASAFVVARFINPRERGRKARGRRRDRMEIGSRGTGSGNGRIGIFRGPFGLKRASFDPVGNTPGERGYARTVGMFGCRFTILRSDVVVEN